MTDSRLFLELSPTADDLWFYWMALLGGATFRRVGDTKPLMVFVNAQGVTLNALNHPELSGNNAQVRRLFEDFGYPCGKPACA